MPESPSLHAGDGYPRGGPEAQNGRLDLYDSAPSGPSGVERLRSLLGTLWGGKWILLGVFALVVSAAATYTYTRASDGRSNNVDSVSSPDGSAAIAAGSSRAASSSATCVSSPPSAAAGRSWLSLCGSSPARESEPDCGLLSARGSSFPRISSSPCGPSPVTRRVPSSVDFRVPTNPVCRPGG